MPWRPSALVHTLRQREQKIGHPGLHRISPVSNLALPERFYMGTNVIYLADLASANGVAPSVPAYRRARLRAVAAASPGSPAPSRPHGPASWVAAAQRRAALRLAPTLTAPVAQLPQGECYALPLVGLPDAPATGRVGSLRLSGRLVDVCAELERLAQAEAAAEARVRRA